MRAVWPVVVAAILIQVDGVSAQNARSGSRVTRTNPGAYAFGKVARTRLIRGRLHAEFGIKQSDGLRAGDRLIVVRPSAGNVVIDEIEVGIVDARQAVGLCVHPRGVEPGDIAIYQRTLDLDIPLAANTRQGGDLYSEITFWSPPKGETRTTFNARLQRITWEGMIDIRDVEAEVFLGGVRAARITIPARSIKQMRLNGIVLVVDGPKKTLVAAAVHDYREVVRVDAAERERIEIAKARIASEERVRIAAAHADARVRIAAARARSESDERTRMAEVASRERIEMARIERDYSYAREQVAANAGSGRQLSRALTAVGGLLQIGASFYPEGALVLEGLAGGTAVLQAIIQ